MPGIEAKIERKVCKDALRRYGVHNIKIQKAGFPDRIFLIPGGAPLFIEFKAPGEEPRPMQAYYIDMLDKLGYHATWCNNYEGAMEVIGECVKWADVGEK
jgi:hypothetical protein